MHWQFESLSALKKQVAELFEVSKQSVMNKERGGWREYFGLRKLERETGEWRLCCSQIQTRTLCPSFRWYYVVVYWKTARKYNMLLNKAPFIPIHSWIVSVVFIMIPSMPTHLWHAFYCLDCKSVACSCWMQTTTNTLNTTRYNCASHLFGCSFSSSTSNFHFHYWAPHCPWFAANAVIASISDSSHLIYVICLCFICIFPCYHLSLCLLVTYFRQSLLSLHLLVFIPNPPPRKLALCSVRLTIHQWVCYEH